MVEVNGIEPMTSWLSQLSYTPHSMSEKLKVKNE